MARMLDVDHRCRLGDRAAGLWGATRAVFVRSSATHVFVTDAVDGRRLVLRIVPAGGDAADRVARAAAVGWALQSIHAPSVASVRSLGGALTEEVDGMLVAAQVALTGTTYDEDEVTPEIAWTWGRALAVFHKAAGLLHGDPECDNLIVAADGAAAFVDLDDVRPGAAAADVAFALRAWSRPAGPPELTHPVPAAFLRGYRSVQPFTPEEVTSLAEHSRISAERLCSELRGHLASPADPEWPEWALRLHARLADRAAALDVALGMRPYLRA